ncbi:MAG: hypothetical protein ACQR33_00435 [Candidatus Saccharibacteria bacterium]
MESERFPADGMPPMFPNGPQPEGGKESAKDKKTTRAEKELAQAAIKDVKKPENPTPPSTEGEQSTHESWLGSDKDKTPETDSEPKSAEESEHITSQEARQLVTEYVDQRLPIVEQEHAEAAGQPAEVAAVVANKAFLEHMRDEAGEESDEETPAEVLIDQAVNDVLLELGLEDSVANREAEPVDGTTEPEGAALPDPKSTERRPYYPLHASYEDEAAVADQDLYADKASDAWVHPADAHAAHIEEATVESNSDGGDAGSGGDGPRYPEGAPVDDYDSGSGGIPGYFGGGSAEAEPPHPAIVPNAPSPRVERGRADSERQQDMLKGLLVGGVIGYIVGRRRGRITTEKKFKPIQEQLQKEADTLRQTIANKEQHIRILAREKATVELAAQHTAAKRERLLTAPTKLEQSPAEIRDDTIATILEVPVVNVERPSEDRPPVALREVRARSPQNRLETMKTTPTKQTEHLITPKAIEQLPLPAVVKAAESVVVGGKTLKSFYESGRIEEPALRRILTEHLRTGRTEQALNVALLSQEHRRTQSFERMDRATTNDKGVTAQRQAAIEHHAEQFQSLPGNTTVAPTKDPIDQYEQSESALDVRTTQRNIGIVAGVAIIVAVVLFILLK